MMNTIYWGAPVIPAVLSNNELKLKNNLNILGQLANNPHLKIYSLDEEYIYVDHRYGQMILRKTEGASTRVFSVLKKLWISIFMIKNNKKSEWVELVQNGYLGTRTFQQIYRHEILDLNNWIEKIHVEFIKTWSNYLDPTFLVHDLWIYNIVEKQESKINCIEKPLEPDQFVFLDAQEKN